MIKKYFSFVKFSHTVFALPFAIIGFVLALTQTDAVFHWKTLLFVLLCMVFARNAAMAFNRWADATIDKENPRTANREIPSGEISKSAAALFIVINCVGFVFVAWLLNPLCFYLSPIVLAIILGYSYTKRFTPLCHLILGMGISIAPIGAFLAVDPTVYGPIFLLSAIVLTWVSGFDIIYSMQDVAFDKSQGLHSIPTLLGKEKALQFSRLLHALTVILIIGWGQVVPFHWLYWLGAVSFAALLFYQHRLVSPTDLSKVNLAFFTTNGIASIVFACFVVAALLV